MSSFSGPSGTVGCTLACSFVGEYTIPSCMCSVFYQVENSHAINTIDMYVKWPPMQINLDTSEL